MGHSCTCSHGQCTPRITDVSTQLWSELGMEQVKNCICSPQDHPMYSRTTLCPLLCWPCYRAAMGMSSFSCGTPAHPPNSWKAEAILL